MPTAPSSPPKRMTRARAKAVEDQTTAPKKTRITTPSAQAARATKRKTRDDDEEGQRVTSAPAVNVTPHSEAVKPARGRPKKVTIAVTETTEAVESDSELKKVGATAPKGTRGRSRKTAVAVSSTNAEPAPDTSVPTRQASKIRATSAKRTAASQPQLPKKTVTFEDTAVDKENIFVTSDMNGSGSSVAKGKPSHKLTGFRAAPVRRPPGRKAARRGKPAPENAQECESVPKLPLSPKKEKQVAKADLTASEDDELNAPETPAKTLSKSPLKGPISILRKTPLKPTTSSIPMSASMFANQAHPGFSTDGGCNHTLSITFPTEGYVSSILTSPAKRPPPSPFKNSLKVSPVKAPGTVQRSAPSGETEKPISKLQMSPKKFALGRPEEHPMLKAPSILLKASTLQSPARRPTSPTKTIAHCSPGTRRAAVAASTSHNGPESRHSARSQVISPGKMLTSSLRAVRAPEQSLRVHVMTTAEQVEMFKQELAEPLFRKRSPNEEDSVTGRQEDLTSNNSAMQDSSSSPTTTCRLPVRSPQASPPKRDDEEVVPKTLESENHLDTLAATAESSCSTKPMPHPHLLVPYFKPRTPATEIYLDYESEDELQSSDHNYTPTPFARGTVTARDLATPTRPSSSSGGRTPCTQKAFAALTEQLQNWRAATPKAELLEQRKAWKEPVFSPMKRSTARSITLEPADSIGEAVMTSCFEEEMALRADAEMITDEEMIVHEEELHDIMSSFSLSQVSEASQEYGDENEMPIDPALLELSRVAPPATATCTPAKVVYHQPRVIHTVSKIPLKPAAEDSPSRKPLRRRNHSMSGPLAPTTVFGVGYATDWGVSLQAPSTPKLAATKASKFSEVFAPNITPPILLETPKLDAWSIAGSPARTPRADLDGNLLSGAIVYVDVHTTEGADASGIFVELLTQMGAKCVKQWSWNPRTSTAGRGAAAVEGTESPASGKVGITHVVFKDGGRRTMEKVREAKDVVACVGVGWVLDCERENKWVDEAEYAIDVSIMPRGGHRRRKSMEPRIISNVNGNLGPADSAAKSIAEMSPTKEFLTFSSPTSRRESLAMLAAERRVSFAPPLPPPAPDVPSTPLSVDDETTSQTPAAGGYTSNIYSPPDGESSFGSPMTPYFLRPDQLVQQTCPPKQSQPLLFPLSGRIEDQPDEGIRQRLLLARRKSLQWAPKVGSPLARGFSYGL